MSIQTKETLKRVGAIALGTMAVGGLSILVMAILGILNARIDSTQAEVSRQANVIESVKTDTHWIRTYLCSKDKSPNCPIPTN